MSIGHDVETLDICEVSLCVAGFRKGAVILSVIYEEEIDAFENLNEVAVAEYIEMMAACFAIAANKTEVAKLDSDYNMYGEESGNVFVYDFKPPLNTQKINPCITDKLSSTFQNSEKMDPSNTSLLENIKKEQNQLRKDLLTALNNSRWRGEEDMDDDDDYVKPVRNQNYAFKMSKYNGGGGEDNQLISVPKKFFFDVVREVTKRKKDMSHKRKRDVISLRKKNMYRRNVYDDYYDDDDDEAGSDDDHEDCTLPKRQRLEKKFPEVVHASPMFFIQPSQQSEKLPTTTNTVPTTTPPQETTVMMDCDTPTTGSVSQDTKRNQ